MATIRRPSSSDAELYALFDELDRDKSGVLTVDELARGAEHLFVVGASLPRLKKAGSIRKDAAADFVRRFDQDGDGGISRDELVKAIRSEERMLFETFGRLGETSAPSVEAISRAFAPYFADEAQLSRFAAHAHEALVAAGPLTFDSFQDWVKQYRIHTLTHELDRFRTLDTGSHVAAVETEGRKAAGSSGHAASALRLSAAGLLAGTVSRVLTAPFERLKVMRATGQLPPGEWRAVLSDLVRREGVRTFWRGTFANVLKVAPSKALKFALYDQLISTVTRNPRKPTTAETLGVSCSVAVVVAACTHPLDTVKTMLAAGASPPSTLGMLTKVVRERGVSGLFAGLPATLTSTVPFIGVSWSAFNVGKAQYNTLHGRDPMQKPPVTALLGLGVLSTAAAELVGYPLYLIKTNQQSALAGVGGVVPAGARASSGSAWQVAKAIVAARGPLGLYSGVGIATLKSAPAACITYYIFETAKDM